MAYCLSNYSIVPVGGVRANGIGPDYQASHESYGHKIVTDYH